jgi:hypothetical protein
MTDSFGPPPSSISTENISSPAPASLKPAVPLAPAKGALQAASLKPAVPLAPVKGLAPRSPSSSPENLISPPSVPRVPDLQPASAQPVVSAAKSVLQPASLPVAPVKPALQRKYPLSAQELQEKAGMKDTLAELASLAQTLNSETDDLNDIIQTINGKLRAFNFGIQVWCKGPATVDFGFARLGDPSEWQLAARSVVTDFGDGRKEYSYAPLLKRSRDERVEGLELVPDILRELKKDAAQKVSTIRRAKVLAASL